MKDCFAKIRLLVAGSAFLLVMFKDASVIASDDSLTASGVLEHIEKVGPKSALNEYWKSRIFIQILDGIGTADPEWLEVYSRLLAVSDAGASEDLAEAIYDRALPTAPFRVIALVQRTEGWSTESICTFGFDATCPPDGIWPYLNRLEHALGEAKTPWEVSVRNVCMKGIRAARIQFPKKRAIDYCRYGAKAPAAESPSAPTPPATEAPATRSGG